MDDRPQLVVRWLPLTRARIYVRDHHRHLPRVVGGVLAIGCYGVPPPELFGVLILGRPTARLFDRGEIMEVTRCAHTGIPNVGSALYARARVLAHGLGVHAVTYTLEAESGSSLRGAGWVEGGAMGTDRDWSRQGRTRDPARVDGPGRRWWCCAAARCP